MVRNTETAFVPNLRGGDGTIEIRHILNKDELMGHASMYAHVIIPAHAKGLHTDISIVNAMVDFIRANTPLAPTNKRTYLSPVK